MTLGSSMNVTSSSFVADVPAHDGLDAHATRAEKKARSRRRILDSAKDVFFRDGFMITNLDEVASKAGVAKGTLYRYFESKADLYVAVLAENGKSFTDKLEAVSYSGDTALERIRAMGDFYLDHWTNHRDYFQIFWAIDNQSLIGGLPQEALDEVSKLWETSLSILQAVVDGGVRTGEFKECDSWELSYVIWTMANGLIQSEYTGARRELRRQPLQKVYRDGIDWIVTGVVART